jgi:hypothetical protein
VYGGLLGTQEGRATTIANSFELICTPGVGPDPAIDMDYLRQRVEAGMDVDEFCTACSSVKA